MRAVEVELGANAGAMVLNRADADAQDPGDLFAGLVFGEKPQDAPFGGGQVGEGGALVAPTRSPAWPDATSGWRAPG